MKCLHCNAENSDSLVYCQNCGQYLATRRHHEAWDTLKALVLGIFCTSLFYILFLPLIHHSYIKELFAGGVCQTITGVSLWSFFLLVFKYGRYREQARACRLFRHPEMHRLFAQGIYARDIPDLMKQVGNWLVAQKFTRFQNALIFSRVRRLLHHIQFIPKKEEVHTILDYQAQIDYNRMENSYSLLNVFIWAIPILGFLGTVYGIGLAIGDFAEFIRSVNTTELTTQMRSALSGVTGGLSVAFNTTLLALLFVIPIMVWASALRKSEEELLIGLDEYCLETLLPHLHITPGAEAQAEAFDEHLHKIMTLSNNWLTRFEPLMDSLGMYANSLKGQIAGLQPFVKETSEALFQLKNQALSPAALAPEAEPSQTTTLNAASSQTTFPPRTEEDSSLAQVATVAAIGMMAAEMSAVEVPLPPILEPSPTESFQKNQLEEGTYAEGNSGQELMSTSNESASSVND